MMMAAVRPEDVLSVLVTYQYADGQIVDVPRGFNVYGYDRILPELMTFALECSPVIVTFVIFASNVP
jgi:hypothetical protein